MCTANLPFPLPHNTNTINLYSAEINSSLMMLRSSRSRRQNYNYDFVERSHIALNKSRLMIALSRNCLALAYFVDTALIMQSFYPVALAQWVVSGSSWIVYKGTTACHVVSSMSRLLWQRLPPASWQRKANIAISSLWFFLRAGRRWRGSVSWC